MVCSHVWLGCEAVCLLRVSLQSTPRCCPLSEAPKRRTHSFPRHNSHGANRDPPPRIVIGDPSQADGLGRNCWVPSATSVYCVGRRTPPSGTTPSRTSRHKAI